MNYKFRNRLALKLAEKLPSRFVHFRTDENGATIVEFAMLAFPFFVLIFAIIETSLFFFANQYLETAVDDTMRLFRTGQLGPATTDEIFKRELCGRINVLFDCDEIRTDVQVSNRFDQLLDPDPLDDEGEFIPGGFAQNCARCVVQISASYKWPVYTNFPARNVENASDFTLMNVVAVSQTEPFDN